MYLFDHLSGHITQRRIDDYFVAHWPAWFPTLPRYQAFNYRLQQLILAFELFIEDHLFAAAKRKRLGAADRLSDSSLVMLAVGTRANRACVARQLADVGF
jgi:hypothetical protein